MFFFMILTVATARAQPLLPLNPGIFNGLVRNSLDPQHETTAYISAKLTPKGAMSGSLILAGVRHSFSGLWPTNVALPTFEIRRRGTNALLLSLASTDPDSLTGTLTDGSWSSSVSAARQVWDRRLLPASSHAGIYTASIDRSAGVNRPDGFGYGTITVDPAGAIKWVGVLGDGTKVTQKTTISAQGQWPFYAAFGARKGSVSGWLPVSNSIPTDGSVFWRKFPDPASPRYPAGFGATTTMHLSSYVPPALFQRVINITRGYVTLDGGPLASPIVNELSLNLDNKITNLGQYPTVLSINTRSGLLRGSIVYNGVYVGFTGVIMQSVNLGIGQFLSSTLSGAMILAGDSQ